MTILITGGAGFIGSHLVRHLVKTYPHYTIVNIDALTYAANLARLDDVKDAPNYLFVKGNINDSSVVENVFQSHSIDAVIHLAAESHVDRSIEGPMPFANTNIIGTMTLLNACRTHWEKESNHRFYHISTDEVYGSWEKKVCLPNKALINLDHPMQLQSKCRSYGSRLWRNLWFAYVISNCSNNMAPTNTAKTHPNPDS